MHRIVSTFESSPALAFNYKQISKLIGVETNAQKLNVAAMLEEMAISGFLKEVDRGRYRLNNLGTIAEGTFVRRSNGKTHSSLMEEELLYLLLNTIPPMPWMETG